MRNIRFLVLIGVCVVPNLMAQTDRGVITGTVKDVSGAVVPGAQVTAIQTNTNANFKTKTTTSGDFTVPSLPVGSYQVRVAPVLSLGPGVRHRGSLSSVPWVTLRRVRIVFP